MEHPGNTKHVFVVHPYYIATQAHPEMKSRPARAHPHFSGLNPPLSWIRKVSHNEYFR